MKEEILPICVKNFISKAAEEQVRLDGRNFDEFRHIEVHFGKEWGCCQVSFGETKVLATASCDVQLPKATRPNEGLLHVNVELSPMAAVHFESGPPSDLAVHLNRLLEKFFKESRCVDLESLCIVAEDKVWNIRVDINVLNADGNLVGCCSAAALAALMHFRRPDFSLSGEQVIIHSPAEQDPIPISLHHHLVAISFAVFNNGERVMVDPNGTEERVSQAQLVLAVNTYRELCGLHMSGTALTAPDLILYCAHQSAALSAFLIGKIKDALQADLDSRKKGPVSGLPDCIHLDRILSSSMDRSTFRLKAKEYEQKDIRMDLQGPSRKLVSESESEDEEVEIVAIEEMTAEMRPKLLKEKEMKPWVPTVKGNQWLVEEHESSNSADENEDDDDDDDKEDSDSEVEVIKQVTLEDRVIDNIELSEDSEEDETVVLKSSDVNNG